MLGLRTAPAIAVTGVSTPTGASSIALPEQIAGSKRSPARVPAARHEVDRKPSNSAFQMVGRRRGETPCAIGDASD